jgi:serine/threonine-protein kinase
VEPRAAAVPALGVATVTSTPSGVPVAIDGIARGATPLALALPAGPHRVSVGTGDAPTERRVQVSAGTDAFLHVEWPVTAEPAKTLAPAPAPTVVAMRPAPPRALVNVVETPRVRESIAFKPAPLGWVSVSSPFVVQVFEDGRDIGSSDGDRLPLAAGTHTLTLVNRSLEVSEERTITVVAKREVALTIEASRGTLNLNARPWAEVWLDGKRVGDTPLGNLSVAIGEHELLFRHPTLGDQRRRVVVGARSPVRVAVEYNP